MLRSNNLVALLCGTLFALGLGVSGMTQPQKIVRFLDLFGNWDPTLIFVMIGAILVHAVSFLVIKKMDSPLLATKFLIPTKNSLSKDLLTGSAIFGIGWGMAGFCPGPGLTSLFSGHTSSFIFVGAMILGMICFNFLKPYIIKQ